MWSVAFIPLAFILATGNALAGALSQVFVSDITTAHATCGSCGAVRSLATARLYRAAGEVLRCSGCDAVLLKPYSVEDLESVLSDQLTAAGWSPPGET